MFHKKRSSYLILSFCILLFITIFFTRSTALAANDHFGFVLLNHYERTLNIGDSFYLTAITSDGTKPTWRSSSSSIVSVNTYGKVTAKKAGNATITVKSRNGEASCKIYVNKTTITLNHVGCSLENGASVQLTAVTSTGAKVKWKSQKTSIAAVTEDGLVTARKPGVTTVTASVDGSTVTCQIRVKKPTVSLSASELTLYRKGTKQLTVKSSSASAPVWKSNRKSVATVDENGIVTAIKHGTALITVTVDGVSKTCEVLVKQPDISLSQSELSIKKEETFALTAKVSSGNTPVWSSSNTAVATVDSRGNITAHGKGRAYIYAAEDGIKARCTVRVTEENP